MPDKKSGKRGTASGGYDDLIYKLRSTRYVINGLKAHVGGASDGIDGRTKLGHKCKPLLHEAHVSLAVAKDRLAAVLRELGDEPIDGDCL
jgi:hypothetical protein